MKWKCVAAGVISICGANCALAQSTVNIYGALDVYVGIQRATNQSNRKVVNSGFNPNSLGFAGTEDLGDGLKAGFVLEGQPVLDTGTYGQGGKFFGRQSLLFLSGGWGKFAAGRQHTAGRAFGIKYSSTGWLATDPQGQLQFAMGAGINPAMNGDTVGARVSNAVSYVSPNVAGFNVSLLQSAAEGGQFSAGQAKVSVVGINYAAGKFSADFVYNRIADIAGSQIKQDDFGLGGTFDAGFAKFLAAVQMKRGSAVATPGSVVPIAGSEATDRFFTVGAQIPVATYGLIGASIGKLNVSDEHKGRYGANISVPFTNVMGDAKAWGLSYSYFLSKRTTLFAAYGGLKNSATGNASLTVDLRPSRGGTSSLAAVGLRHAF